MSIFNTCIITTSSEKQCEIYRALIKKRIEHGLYPAQIQFFVFADPEGRNIGSGGATVLALKNYMEKSGISVQSERILVINAGGKDHQIPFYASEGILFTPVPLSSSSVIPPVVLDLHITLFLKYPWNNGEVVAVPADVIADFDASELIENRGDICGFAARVSLLKGASHGVFKFDSYRSNIINYFQKAEPQFLQENAILEGTGECAVDMGIVSFSKKFISALLNMFSVKKGQGSLFDQLMSGSLSFSIYLELITATLYGIDYNTFYSRISSRTMLDESILQLFYNTLNKFHLVAHLARSASFLHLSSVSDYLHSCLELRNLDLRLFYTNDYHELQVSDVPHQIVFNSYQFMLPLGNHKLVVGECVRNCTLENVLGNNLLCGISDWVNDSTIPEGICIDQRIVSEEKVRIIAGVDDTFKDNILSEKIIYCGIPLKQWLGERNLTMNDLWDKGERQNLLNAKLFPTNFPDEFLTGYWARPMGEQWTEKFRSGRRFSIQDLNNLTDGVKQDSLRIKIRSNLLRKQVLSGKGWSNTSINDFSLAFSNDPPVEQLSRFYDSTDDYLLKLYRGRLLEEVSGTVKEEWKPEFHISELDKSDIMCNAVHGIGLDKIVLAQCPVRIDIAGGWTDMPPFTLRSGGAVISFSANLNGKPPVQVFCKKTKDPLVRLISIDKGAWETISEFEHLDSEEGLPCFSLQKAILSYIGFGKKCCSNRDFSSLDELLKKLGFGIELTTFCSVPCGSGLGTSSILASTILASLYRVLGKSLTLRDQVSITIGIEQHLKSGGGWQDQLGGITGGLKYIQSKPGLFPDPLIYHLDNSFLSKNIGLFTLFYTGIRRPVTHLLSEVARQMNANIPAYEFTLHYLKQLAMNARNAIETNNLNEIENIMNNGRKAGSLIFSGADEPELFKQLHGAKKDYSAVKFTGAGGGGYVLFLSESLEKASNLREFLRKNIQNNSAVVPFSLNEQGLEITVLQ